MSGARLKMTNSASADGPTLASSPPPPPGRPDGYWLWVEDANKGTTTPVGSKVACAQEQCAAPQKFKYESGISPGQNLVPRIEEKCCHVQCSLDAETRRNPQSPSTPAPSPRPFLGRNPLSPSRQCVGLNPASPWRAILGSPSWKSSSPCVLSAASPSGCAQRAAQSVGTTLRRAASERLLPAPVDGPVRLVSTPQAAPQSVSWRPNHSKGADESSVCSPSPPSWAAPARDASPAGRNSPSVEGHRQRGRAKQLSPDRVMQTPASQLTSRPQSPARSLEAPFSSTPSFPHPPGESGQVSAPRSPSASGGVDEETGPRCQQPSSPARAFRGLLPSPGSGETVSRATLRRVIPPGLSPVFDRHQGDALSPSSYSAHGGVTLRGSRSPHLARHCSGTQRVVPLSPNAVAVDESARNADEVVYDPLRHAPGATRSATTQTLSTAQRQKNVGGLRSSRASAQVSSSRCPAHSPLPAPRVDVATQCETDSVQISEEPLIPGIRAHGHLRSTQEGSSHDSSPASSQWQTSPRKQKSHRGRQELPRQQRRSVANVEEITAQQSKPQSTSSRRDPLGSRSRRTDKFDNLEIESEGSMFPDGRRESSRSQPKNAAIAKRSPRGTPPTSSVLISSRSSPAVPDVGEVKSTNLASSVLMSSVLMSSRSSPALPDVREVSSTSSSVKEHYEKTRVRSLSSYLEAPGQDIQPSQLSRGGTPRLSNTVEQLQRVDLQAETRPRIVAQQDQHQASLVSPTFADCKMQVDETSNNLDGRIPRLQKHHEPKTSALSDIPGLQPQLSVDFQRQMQSSQTTSAFPGLSRVPKKHHESGQNSQDGRKSKDLRGRVSGQSSQDSRSHAGSCHSQDLGSVAKGGKHTELRSHASVQSRQELQSISTGQKMRGDSHMEIDFAGAFPEGPGKRVTAIAAYEGATPHSHSEVFGSQGPSEASSSRLPAPVSKLDIGEDIRPTADGSTCATPGDKSAASASRGTSFSFSVTQSRSDADFMPNYDIGACSSWAQDNDSHPSISDQQGDLWQPFSDSFERKEELSVSRNQRDEEFLLGSPGREGGTTRDIMGPDEVVANIAMKTIVVPFVHAERR